MQIEAEYDKENQKVIEQKKILADHNSQVSVIQRKIEQCPSNVEITQFHKRLIELFDNFNFKSEENRKYFSLYNTVIDTKKMFNMQLNYMTEINQVYSNAKKKKDKEVLLHNLKNIVGIIQEKQHTPSIQKLEDVRSEYRGLQRQYDDCILSEKDHFNRIREFEEECEKNDKLREMVEGKQ